MPSCASVIVLLCFAAIVHPLSCKDESGASVDWFYALKVPRIPSNANPFVAAGYAYMYADANSPKLSWSRYSLRDNTTGGIALTLSQIYSSAKSSSVAWLLYNDQLPNKEFTNYAHSKGVLAGDSYSGFWLVHSVPRFPVSPSQTESYYFPSYEVDNGQSFLCVSYSASTIDKVASLFLINKPYIYENNFPASLQSTYSSIALVLKGQWITSPTATHQQFISLQGAAFTAFAKNAQWDKELYEDYVSPTFSTGMFIQTWREGASSDLEPSYCAPKYKYDNQNILSLQAYDAAKSATITWSYTKDHSKWGITSTKASGYGCIGDINRMFSQATRGGGTVCTNNANVYQSLSNMIATLDKC